MNHDGKGKAKASTDNSPKDFGKSDEVEMLAEKDESAGSEDELTAPNALEIRIEELEAALAEAGDRRLRAVTEAENTRKRTSRELDQLRRYAYEGLAKSLLSPIDNLERALSAVPREALKKSAELKTLHQGVEMIEKEFLIALSQAGVERYDPVGEDFDPNNHSALFEDPASDLAPGKISAVVAKGYRYHDRILRPAMVGVSKAPPSDDSEKSAPDEPGPEPQKAKEDDEANGKEEASS